MEVNGEGNIFQEELNSFQTLTNFHQVMDLVSDHDILIVDKPMKIVIEDPYHHVISVMVDSFNNAI